MHVLTIIVQWLHVAAAIVWVGGSVILELVVRPIMERMATDQQRAVGKSLGRALVPYFAVAGSATIVFGILRGTVFGQIQSLHALVEPYGITWLIALSLSAILAVLGAVGIGRTMTLYYNSDALWSSSTKSTESVETEDSSAELERQTHVGPSPVLFPMKAPDPITAGDRIRSRLVLYGRLQLVGFGVILVCMQLMTEVFSS